MPLPFHNASNVPYPSLDLFTDAGTSFDEELHASPNPGSQHMHLSYNESLPFESSYTPLPTEMSLGSGNLESIQTQEPRYQAETMPWTAQSLVPLRGATRRARSPPDSRLSEASLSPFEPSHALMATCNNHLVTDNLLRIYHDVLENNLACWLTEDNCPYKMRPRQPVLLASHPNSRTSTSDDQSSREWGAVWSNRMYKRVKDLDRAARSIGLIQLTKTDDQKASKALNLSIMAFAAQWAQGGRRREKFPPCFSDEDESESAFGDGMDSECDMGDEFEQHFQLHLWESAKRTLDEVEDLESFKVIYAELIFGLIQKPWLAGRSQSQWQPKGSDGEYSTLRELIFSQIRDIIGEEGPPVYLDRASRKIHTLKFRHEAQDTGVWESSASQPSSRQNSRSSLDTGLNEKQRATIGLLYWLAVMFDTVSSSINQRPVVVADEDCQHDSASATSPESTSTFYSRGSLSEYRWDLSLFSQDDPDRPSTLRWPCPYEDAANAVTRSAAVKVLLFRYVSYLQNAMRKSDNSQAIEDIIHSVTKVYRYWNITHGALFRDLINSYDSIPARIKSWFPCIHIPWNLGSLLIADLIDMVDENGLGSDQGRSIRANSNLTARIRKSSALELADLAKVTTPQDGDGQGMVEQLPSYHFAVNEGTLLTEPWTVLLIRAFAKACIFHLTTAEDLRHNEWEILGQESAEYGESLKRADACIKALWFLGRKSEMARSLSLVFAGAIRRLETKRMSTADAFWRGSPL